MCSEDHSDSDVAKALSAFDDALARVLVGELHRHAMNEARKGNILHAHFPDLKYVGNF